MLWFIAPADWDRKLCVLYISVCVLLWGEPRERISPTLRCWSPDSTGTDGERVKYGKWTHHLYLKYYMLTHPPTFTPKSVYFHSKVCKLELKSFLCALGLIWEVQSVRISPGSGFSKIWIPLLKNSRAGKQEIVHNRYCVCTYTWHSSKFVRSEVAVCYVINSRDFGWN